MDSDVATAARVCWLRSQQKEVSVIFAGIRLLMSESESMIIVLTTAREWDYGFRLGSISQRGQWGDGDVGRLHLR